MKADRLLAALLYLQAHERVTVDQLAVELEVSRRTARRDLEALATAGVPVYPRRGRHGGWSLVGGARLELNGLTAREIRALFLVAGPSAATRPALRLALRKLVRALPATLRSDAETASKAVVIDDDSFCPPPSGGPHLSVLQQAVLDGVQVRIRQVGDPPEHEQVVHPWGLVVSRGAWHLVAGTDGGPRALGLRHVASVTVTDRTVERPADLDLPTLWRALADATTGRTPSTPSRLRARRDALPVLHEVLPGRLRIVHPLPEDRVEVEVDGSSPEVLASRLAGLGDRVEVLGPPETRQRLARIADELAGLYR